MIARLASPLIRRPLLCVAVLWSVGILVARFFDLPWVSWAIAALLLLSAWVITTAANNPAARLALLLGVACLGAARYAHQAPYPLPGDPRFLPAQTLVLFGYPLAHPVRTATGWRMPFRLTGRLVNAHHVHATGDVLLSGRAAFPEPGHQFRIVGRTLPDLEPGNPFGFSWRAYLLEHDYTYAVSMFSARSLPTRAPVPLLSHWREILSRRLAAAMPVAYGDIYAQLLDGLLLGVRGVPLPSQFTDQFRRAGTIHLMIVSGSQVTLLGGLLLFPLWFVQRGRAMTTYPRARIVLLALSLPVLGFYVLLADRGPSVDRALLMSLLCTLSVFLAFSGLARRRAFRVDILTLLAVAALAMLIVNPALLFSPGMQLSYAAVFGLATATPLFLRLCRQPFGPLALWPSATLGAQCMTVPILAWHFGAIPLLAPFTNLIAVPVVAMLVPLGLLAMGLALVAPMAAQVLNLCNVQLLNILLGVNAAAAWVPWAEWHYVTRSTGLVVLYYLCLAAALRWLSQWVNSHEAEWTIPTGSEPRMW